MGTHWDADVTNDPARDFELCIELTYGDKVRGTVRRDEAGVLVLTWCASTEDVTVSAEWLARILVSAQTDLPR